MKTATLVAFDTTIAAIVEVDPDFYGYPRIGPFDGRRFVFREMAAANFTEAPVGSTMHAFYDEATEAAFTVVPELAVAA